MTQTSQEVQNYPHMDSIKYIPENRENYEEEFMIAMHRLDVEYKGKIIADGKIHRFETQKKGRKDGWYVFHGIVGAFGDWSRNIRERWSIKDENLSPQEKERLQYEIAKARKISKVDWNRKHEVMARLILRNWDKFLERGHHPYLVKKQIKAFGARFRGIYLFIPLRDITGKIWNLQYISPGGAKLFLAGGRAKGCFHHIGILENGKPIFVTEGYSTGASIHMATQQTTVITFSAGNLDSVIGELKRMYPISPITIAGDDDRWREHNVGRTKAEEAARKYNCSIVFPIFKNTELMPTDFNDLHVTEGLEEVKSQLELATRSNEWPEPKLINTIKKDLSPVMALSTELVPEPYQDWLIDITERMQCPLDYVAVGAVLVTASIIGAGCSIKPKAMDSWTVIPNLWGGIIGLPSTLKSPALKEILRPLEILEAQAFETYEKDLQNYWVELEGDKATKEVIKKEMVKAAAKSDMSAMNEAKGRLRSFPEQKRPHCKRYSTNDATIEKMHELLSKNSRGLLLFRDELMGLLSHWDKDGNEADRSFYLEAWNGYGSKITDRIGRGTILTKNLCISLLGSTQPSKLVSYFQRALGGVENDGLLQRFQLLVYPDDTKDWKLVDRKPNEKSREQAFSIIVKLAEMNFCKYGAQLDEKSEIPYFHFDAPAQEIFYEWLTELEGKLRNTSDEPVFIEHLAKYRKLLPSLALIFHLINIASGKISGPVTKECVQNAARWCEYLEAHIRRIYESALCLEYQAARNLARKIQEGEFKNHFNTRDVYRKEGTLLKNREEVEAACTVLIESGWIREGSLSEEGKPKKCYFINPKVLAKPHP